ncbi:MAG TPA: oligosaccharide flippase family protein, partial [Tepidisphaeraceae bacterium]
MEREGKHVLSHAGIYLIARGVPGVMAFVAIPLFSRLLTKEQYGQYALVIATVGLLNSLVFEWLRLSLVRYLPVYRENPERLQSVLATTAALLIMASGIVAGTIFLLPIHSAWRAMAIPCWIALAVQALFDLASQYSRAVLRPWQFMVLALARSTAMVVVGAALI